MKPNNLHSNLNKLYESKEDIKFNIETLTKLIQSRWENGIKAVFLTKSTIFEEIYLPSDFDEESLLIEYDSNIQNFANDEENLIIIKCSEFDLLHFAHLKSFLDQYCKYNNDKEYNIFIIYCGCDPEYFKELSIFRWPILSMEDISVHPELDSMKDQQEHVVDMKQFSNKNASLFIKTLNHMNESNEIINNFIFNIFFHH